MHKLKKDRVSNSSLPHHELVQPLTLFDFTAQTLPLESSPIPVTFVLIPENELLL